MTTHQSNQSVYVVELIISILYIFCYFILRNLFLLISIHLIGNNIVEFIGLICKFRQEYKHIIVQFTYNYVCM